MLSILYACAKSLQSVLGLDDVFVARVGMWQMVVVRRDRRLVCLKREMCRFACNGQGACACGCLGELRITVFVCSAVPSNLISLHCAGVFGCPIDLRITVVEYLTL